LIIYEKTFRNHKNSELLARLINGKQITKQETAYFYNVEEINTLKT